MSMPYKKTVFNITVISEADRTFHGIEDVAQAVVTGDCSGVVEEAKVIPLSLRSAAKALEAQGSDPEFLLDESELPLLDAPEKTIQAEFVLQAWTGPRGDQLEEIERQSVGVTDYILSMPLEWIHELKDDADSSDTLVEVYTDHSGPHAVHVTDAVCVFFGVEDLMDITEAALIAARKHHGV